MQKNKLYMIIAAAVIVIGGLIYFITSNSFDYKVLDEINEESERGNMTFLFVNVSELDSASIYKASQELMKERIIAKYANAEIPKDMDHGMIPSDILIAYFYSQDDTTAIPEQMQEVLKSKFPSNDIIKMKLNYISEGFMYTGVYNPGSKKVSLDSLSPRTMLFVPKPGVKAKDIMNQMPKGNSEMDQLPEGHPKVDMNQMPEGHPGMDMNQMPEGHPKVDMNQMPEGHPSVKTEPKSGKK